MGRVLLSKEMYVAHGTVPVLIGRDHQVELLRRQLNAAVAGAGHVVLIEGESGIGKTRLVREAIGPFVDQVETAWAGADEFDATRPFSMLATALSCYPTSPDKRRAEIGRIITDVRPVDGTIMSSTAPDRRYQVVENIIALVEDMACYKPVFLVLDDLQWADPSTLLTLHHLIQRTATLAVAVLVTYRPAPLATHVSRLVDKLLDAGATHLQLAALGTHEALELAEHLLGAPPGQALQRELAGANGNPLLILELLRALMAENVLDIGNVVELQNSSLPQGFRKILRRRLGIFPESTLTLLRVAAVMGSTFEIGELSAILGRPVLELLPSLDEALAAGILVEAEKEVAFAHNLLRTAIYQDLPESLRRSLHRDIATMLARTGAPARRVARHFDVSTEPGDSAATEAAEWLRRAAAGDSAVAPVQAVELLTRALELAPAASTERTAVSIDLARALMWSGRPAEAAELARSLLEGPHGQDIAATIRPVLATALMLDGRLQQGVDETERAAAEPGVSTADRAWLLFEASLGRLMTGDLNQAEVQARRSILEGEKAGDVLAQCLANCTRAWVLNARGDLPTALDIAQRAISRIELEPPQVRNLAIRHSPHFFLGTLLTIADRYEEAGQCYDTARRFSEETGSLSLLPSIHCGQAIAQVLSGKWDDALAEVEAGLSFAGEVGSRAGVVWHHALRAQIYFRRQDATRAHAAVTAGQAELQRSGPQFGLDWLVWANALLVEEAGDPAAALARLEGVWDLYEVMGIVTHRVILGPDLFRLAAAAHDDKRMEVVVEALEQNARRTGVTGATVTAMRCRGLLAGDIGLLEQAVTLSRTTARTLIVAGACEDLALALAPSPRATDRQRARTIAQEAIDLYDLPAATWHIARLSTAVGIRRRRRKDRPDFGWESLTDTEVRVSGLVATGMSNRKIAEELFVSHRTVETHVSNSLQKLGLSSRVELATEAVAQAHAQARAGMASP